MITPLSEVPPSRLCCEDETPVDPRTMPQWPVSVSLAVVGLLVLASVPLVSGQRGFGVTGDTSPYKGYSGIRARPEAERLIYYHEQTIAVVEVGPKRELFNCELIEVTRIARMGSKVTRIAGMGFKGDENCWYGVQRLRELLVWGSKVTRIAGMGSR
ncbi:hypothetical protein J6590_042925 [Homalodisca vitripennis]|nr:hypothetical protein J6590_042925 [Homalodisca vitripennis]